MKRFRNLCISLCFVVLCTSILWAAEPTVPEYQLPDNFIQLMDQTYDVIYRSIQVDENLSYEILLFDETFMALSALTRGGQTQLTFQEIKDYFQKSIKRYDIPHNFILMVVAFDKSGTLNLSDLPTRLFILDSNEQEIYGEIMQGSTDRVFILSFPPETMQEYLASEEEILIQIRESSETILETNFSPTYRKEIPAEIQKFIDILMISDPEPTY